MKKIFLLILTCIALFACPVLQAQVCNAPVINSFSPNTGLIGSTVTITGANFNATPANNQVFFGATQATVLTASFGVLTVTVPVGASTAPIAVKNNCNLIAYSSTSFNGIFCPTPITASTYQNTAFTLGGISGAYNMISQDIDLDGKPDVISSNGGSLTIARNTSSPGALSFVAYNTNGGGSSIATADFDGDGKREILTPGGILRNLSTPGTINMQHVGFSYGGYQISCGDFNNDGKIDIVADGRNGYMYFYRNTSTGPGNFGFAAAYTVYVQYGSTGVQVADVDGDGKTDVLASQGDGNRSISLRNTTTAGATAFTFETYEAWPSNGSYPYRCMIADFDKDGKIDLTTCNYSGTTNTAIYRNTSVVGNISFATTVNLPAPGGNYRIGVGDVNGDGFPDIVTKSASSNIFSVYPNTSTGAGNVSFSARFDYTSSAMGEVSGIVIGDLDGDFVPDIATSGTSSGTIRFHRNSSAQTDNTPPTAACKNITAALSPAGTVTVTAAMIDNGSSDACGLAPLLINNAASVTFTCNDIGANTVTLKVTDRAGNVTTCTAIVTVAPAAIIVAGQSTVCQGQTVALSANQGDSYQWYNNGVAIASATSQNYTATVSGNYTVAVTNAGGCSGTSAATVVTVNNNPTVSTTPSGAASLCGAANNVVLNASTSSIYQWKLNGTNIASATQQTYTATAAGTYSVQVIDLFGCSATSDPITVAATDAIAPTAKCKNATVVIGANGTASISVADINDGSFDNCSGITLALSGKTSYTCADAGQSFTVTLTVTDAKGNVNTCTAQVTVTDPNSVCNRAPVAACQAVTVTATGSCQGSATAAQFNNGSTDPDGDALTYSISPAGPFGIGTTPVTLTVTDSRGASSSCTTSITVVDGTPPSIACPGAQTIASCEAVVPNYTTNGVLSDNCTPANAIVVTQSPAAGTAIAPGQVVSVTLTAKDAAGNEAQCSFNVTRPNITPVAANDVAEVCQGASVNINVLANDTHPQGSTLTISEFAQPSVGSVVKNANNTFTYTAPAGYSGPVTFTYVNKANDGTQAFSGTGHFYEYISAPGISWSAANAAANAKVFNGLKGYLGTFTSAAENTFAAQKLQGNGWIGASDLGVEGVWRWVTGPEGLVFSNGSLGLHFSNQYKYGWCDASQAPGINGNFAAWAGGEPNDCGVDNQSGSTNPNRSGEHYAHFYTNGVWNDFPGNAGVDGYVVEYGGLESCIPQLTATATVTITVKALPVVTLAANGPTTFCAGGSVTLDAGAYSSYSWSTGATTRTISVSGSGTYSVSVPGANGCVASGSTAVTVNPLPTPSITASATTICEGGSVTLTAPPASATKTYAIALSNLINTPYNCGSGSYYGDGAYGPVGFSWTDQGVGAPTNINVRFSVGVDCSSTGYRSTSLNGVAGSNFTPTPNCACNNYSQLFTSDFGPAGYNVGGVNTFNIGNLNSATGFVPNGSLNNSYAIVTVTYAAPATYSWTPGGSTASSITVSPSTNTTYTLTATSDAGCVASTSQLITVNANPTAVISTSGSLTVCPGASKVLTAVATAGSGTISGYIWLKNGAVIAGATGTTYAANTTGNYTVKVTNSNGCSTVSAPVTVTVEDHTAPVPTVTTLPTINGECSASVTVAPTATDNCTGTITGVTNDATSYAAQGTYTITWTYNDDNGNSSQQQQTVIVNDTQAPVLTNVPGDVTVECDAVPAAAVLTATDNCDATPAVSYNEVRTNGSCPSNYTLTRTWTATDACGNASNKVQVITVQDTKAPVLTVPANISVNNDANQCSAVVSFAATATDICSTVSITYDKQPGTAFPVGVNTVTATATDACGNASSHTFTITVTDTQVPVISGVPSNITVNALANNCLQLVNWVRPTASDNCGIQSFESNYEMCTGCATLFPVGTTTVTYKATDIHGNVTNASFTVTVKDIQAPTITGCPANITQSATAGKCGRKVFWNPPTPSDNCSGVTFTTNHLPGETYPVGNTVVTYTATDASGNVSTCSFTITITDNEAPVMTSCPAAVTAYTNAGCTATGVALGMATATDNCGAVTITNNAPAAFPLGNTTVTWTATDAAGNTVTCTQVVTVRDNVAPVITVCAPAKSVFTNAGCTATGVVLGTPTGTDNCGAVTFSNNAPAVFPLGNTTVTWTATDAAGNTTTCTQVVTVVDNVKPTITCPPTQTLNLSAGCAGTLPDYRSLAVVSDNCSAANAITITQSPAIGYAVSGVGVTQITLTATDAAGNSQSCTFNVERKDVTPPSITCVEPITVANDANTCGAVVSYAAPVATDNCVGASGTQTFSANGAIQNWTVPAGVTSVTVVAKGAQGGNNGGHGAAIKGDIAVTPGEVIRILVGKQGTAVASSSNSGGGGGGASYVIKQAGNAPLIIAGGGGGLSSPFYTSGAFNPAVSGGQAGNNGASVHNNGGGVNGNGGKSGLLDCCLPGNTGGSGGGGLLSNGGNGSAGSGGSSFLTGGGGGMAGNMYYSPGSGGNGGFGGGGGVAYDNAVRSGGGGGYSGGQGGSFVGGGYEYAHGGGGGSYNAGTNQTNTASANPGDGVVTLTWGGASATVTQVAGLSSGSAFPVGTTTNTFVATDASGNKSQCSFTVTVNDTQVPVIACPQDINVIATSAAGASVSYNTPAGTDNCAGAVTTLTAGLPSGATFPIGTTTVTYTVTDAAGLTAQCSFTVTVVGVPPVVVCPQNITVNNTVGQCGTTVSYTATETTAIPASSITYSHAPGSFFPVGTTVVTVTATNPVGVSTCTFTVIVKDAEMPVLIGVPSNTIVECDAVPAPAAVSATDNCYFSGVVSYTETRVNGACPSTYTLTRTWSTADAAGNTTTASQIITVQDTQAPVLSAAPAHATVECDAVPAAAVLTATDNCDSAPAVSYNEVRMNGNCPSNYTLTRTWTATDACGNASSSTQVITVQDTKAPVLSIPANISVTNNTEVCGAIVSFAATATDNCDAPVITYSHQPGTQFPVGTTTVTVTATDACGNISNGTFTVTVSDTEAPGITAPAAITQTADAGKCYAAVSLGNAAASDNCGVATVSNNAPATFPVGQTTVTWTVTDIHGNTSTATQTVTVTDNEAPVITAPAAITQTADAGNCFATVSLGTPVTGDNCGVASVTSNAPPAFPVGTTTVTWTVVDIHGNNATAIQTVTVTDNEAPVVTCAAAVVVNNDAAQCGATVTLTAPAAADNCGVASVVSNHPAAFYPVGTTVVTWTVTDIHGNTSACTQTVTVTDNQAPSIVCAPAQTQTADAANCSAQVTVTAPVTADNCGVASVTNSYNGTADASGVYPVGTTTILWVVTDIHGNTSNCTQTVTVSDNEKSVVSAPAAITACDDQAGNSKTLTLTASDNCGIQSITYTLSGATTGNGNGVTVTNGFAIGTTTITWTVTDIHGNVSTASATVTINPLPAASITASVDPLCNGVNLTGASTLAGPFAYQWIFGGATVSTSQHINLGTSSANGVYTLFVTDGNGCKSPVAASYTYNNSTGTGTGNYTIVGINRVMLGENNKVESGSVGVTSSYGYALFMSRDTINGSGAFVKAPYMYAQSPYHIPSRIYSPATLSLPAMQTFTGSYSGLPSTTVSSNATLNGNYNSLYIKKNVTVTLGGTTFKTLTMEEGAKVTFTSPVLNMESFYVGNNNNSTGISQVAFAPNTAVRVSRQVKVEEKALINPAGAKVTFYVADAPCNEEKFIVKGNGSVVKADVVMPGGKLSVQYNCKTSGSGGYYDCNDDDRRSYQVNSLTGKMSPVTEATQKIDLSDLFDLFGLLNSSNNSSCATTYMTGLFIAGEVESGKGVVWNNNSNCATSLPTQDNVAPVIDCPVPAVFCQASNGAYSVAAASATDNSGIVSISYKTSGATVRTGNGGDASGVFNVGTTTITFTAKDANGNASTCTTTVKVNATPVVTISQENSFCNNVTLKAVSAAPAPLTYQWSYNNASVGSGQTLNLGSTSPQGIYKVAVTDAAGCTSLAAATYNYQYQNVLGNYTIVGLKEVKLAESNTVVKGSVGVISSSGEASFKKNSSVAGSGAYVKAKDISVQSPVNIPNKIYAAATINLPDMQVFTGSYANCANYTVAQNATVTLGSNYQTLTVKKGANVTLHGTVFKTVSLEEGAKVTFTAAVLNIESLILAKGSSTAYTTVNFANEAAVRVSKQVSIADNAKLNPAANNVTLYVGDLQCDEEKFSVKGGNTYVTANVYLPNGTIKVNGGGASSPTYMTGIFIGEEVQSDAKNVIWNGGYSCPSNNFITRTATPATPEATTVRSVETTTETPEAGISAYPNPNNGQFRLRLTGFAEGVVNVAIIAQNGKTVLVKQVNIGAKTVYASFEVNNLAAGLYTIRAADDKQVQHTKVVVAR